jgi:hypothetical protein
MYKKLLEEALKSIPSDNKHSTLRLCVKRALDEAVSIEKKNIRKQEQLAVNLMQQWKFDAKNSILINPNNPNHTANTIKFIDQMIEEENKKLQSLKSKPSIPDSSPITIND